MKCACGSSDPGIFIPNHRKEVATLRSSLVFVVCCCALAGLQGCTTEISSEPPEEYDILAELVGVTIPDTVQVQQPFTVQVNVPIICNGTFNRFRVIEGLDKLTLEPYIRIKPAQGCPPTFTLETISADVRFTVVGAYTLVIAGRYGDISKPVRAVSNYPPRGDYRFRFLFQGLDGAPKPDQEVIFRLPDRIPPESTSVRSDAAGIWEYVLADTNAFLRYKLADVGFRAQRGIKQNGVLIFP